MICVSNEKCIVNVFRLQYTHCIDLAYYATCCTFCSQSAGHWGELCRNG